MDPNLADAIDALLPQTQCTKCGYAGCRPYAEAIASGEADFDQCPPGGSRGIRALASLLGREEKPLNPAHGVAQAPSVAVIDESRCIGCMLCIRACPVDAIVGAARQMHTVLTRHCTGCELCLPPCPVDCIAMEDVARLAAQGDADAATLQREPPGRLADAARLRYRFRQWRLERDARERSERLAGKARGHLEALEAHPGVHDADRKKAAIRAALERARIRRAGPQT